MSVAALGFQPDRMPPHRIETERCLLGAQVLYPEWIDEVQQVVEPEDYFRESHRELQALLYDLRAEGVPIDAGVVSARMQDRKGESYERWARGEFDDILASVDSGGSTLVHAHHVRAYAQRRRLIAAGEETIRDAYDLSEPAESVLERAEARVFAIAERESCASETPIHRAVQSALARVEERRQGHTAGITTGFVDLDDMLDGLRPRQLILVGARTSVGKSAFAYRVAEHVAFDRGLKVLFVSMEMDCEELGERMLMMRAKVDGAKLRNPALLDEAEEWRLQGVLQEALASVLTIDDAPVRTVAQVAASARRHRARHGLDLLVVDYMQLIDARPRKGESRQEQVARISRRLKGLAREVNVPVLALSQLNREPEKKADKRPSIADFRESGALEQDADVAILLHRPDHYDPTNRPGEAEFIVAKNRGGPTGVVRAVYVKGQTRFDSFAPDEY